MPTARAISSLRSTEKALLLLGGVPAASVEKFTGGEPFCEVIPEPGGLLPYAKKHLGPLQFADLEAQVAVDAHPKLFRWIRDAWFGTPDRENVAFETNTGGDASRSIEMAKARILSVTLPALDRMSRDKRFISLRIQPKGVRRTGLSSAGMERTERECLSHNFELKISGLDCSGVLAVEPFTVVTSIPERTKRATLIFPDLRIYVDAEKADPFREWFEDFVIAGNNDDDKEREGSIEYQDPMLGDPLAVLQILHLGIHRIADEPPPPTGPRRVRVDLYCERMELTSSATVADASDTQPLAPVKF